MNPYLHPKRIIQEFLYRYCDPQPQYTGMTTHELAGMLLRQLAPCLTDVCWYCEGKGYEWVPDGPDDVARDVCSVCDGNLVIYDADELFDA